MSLEEHRNLEDGKIYIFKKDAETPAMWGMGSVTITRKHIQALVAGNKLWFSDGEYAHEIYFEEE